MSANGLSTLMRVLILWLVVGWAGSAFAQSLLGDRVWLDANENGLQDVGEVGVAGVTVRVYDELPDLIGQTVTDSNGNYVFEIPQPGEYIIEFVAPAGYSFTTKNVGHSGPNFEIDSDVYADGSTGYFILDDLVVESHWDAGLVAPATPLPLSPFVQTLGLSLSILASGVGVMWRCHRGRVAPGSLSPRRSQNLA